MRYLQVREQDENRRKTVEIDTAELARLLEKSRVPASERPTKPEIKRVVV